MAEIKWPLCRGELGFLSSFLALAITIFLPCYTKQILLHGSKKDAPRVSERRRGRPFFFLELFFCHSVVLL
jgi:hypothetical protein